MDFLVARDDLHRCRVLDGSPAELEPGQARLTVERFGLSTNNITYAMFGEAMSYWDFFPAEEGWGRVPVWGFAEVAESHAAALQAGARVYGYLPPSSELIVTPARIDARGFVDAAPHRAGLPPAYNGYARVDADPIYEPDTEAEQMLLRPLFFTSYLIDDFLDEADTFGASTVLLSSASSKTSSALAFLLSRREGVEVIGLTSPRSSDFARSLGVYDRVLAYEEIDSLSDDRTVYVDMAGDAAVRRSVHTHYGDALAHSAVVGATHHDRMGDVPDSLPGPRPTFFFAPDRVGKRTTEWGRDGFESRLAESWQPYVEWTSDWLEVIHAAGADAIESAYLDLLDGRIDPAKAHVLSPAAP
jgi:NADPH:quinone reductase-like Zn-dependent oxidoreductase